MGAEFPPETEPDDMDNFLHDIAISVSLHQGVRPALVWPEGCDSVPDELVALLVRDGYPRKAQDNSPSRRPAGFEIDDLTRGLGALLNVSVRSFYWELAARQETDRIRSGADAILLALTGACAFQIRPGGTEGNERTSDTLLNLRLRPGEALYIPQSFDYVIADVHTPSVLLELLLDPPPLHR
jgi:hypothetical protein